MRQIYKLVKICVIVGLLHISIPYGISIPYLYPTSLSHISIQHLYPTNLYHISIPHLSPTFLSHISILNFYPASLLHVSIPSHISIPQIYPKSLSHISIPRPPSHNFIQHVYLTLITRNGLLFPSLAIRFNIYHGQRP